MGKIARTIAGVVAALCFLSIAGAQAPWPAKPITFIVPYAAGGFADIRARKIGQELNRVLGQSIVVENRSGAGGVVGTEFIARAAPDGYTIGSGNLAACRRGLPRQKEQGGDYEKADRRRHHDAR